MFDNSKYNENAYKWAKQFAGDTYKDFSNQQKLCIRNAISTFIKTPRYTIGDVVKELETCFDPATAESIAITETTRAFAQAAQIEGEELKKEWDDVPVVKTWFTCNDDKVCDICKSLDGKEVDISDTFDLGKGIFLPPAHDKCRCWIDTNTKL